MKRTTKSVILFIVLVGIFITLPALMNINQLQRDLNNSLGGAKSGTGLIIPKTDSFSLNDTLEDYVEKNQLSKELWTLRSSAQTQLSALEYDLVLTGDYDQIQSFLKDILTIQGIQLQNLEVEKSLGEGDDLSKKTEKFILRVNALFVGKV